MINKRSNRIRSFAAIALIVISIFLYGNFSFAEDVDDLEENKTFSIKLDKETISKGYTVAAFDDGIKLSLVPGILGSSTDVEVLELHENFEMPWSLQMISEVYQFEFKNKAAYDSDKPFYIQLAYGEQTNCYKKVFFYDKSLGAWRPLPTKDYPQENFVRSLIHLPFARIAVFSYPDQMTVGKASWYSYKKGDFTASPDFPKGSLLRVTNIDNGKFVDVTVNDFGPDRKIHPDRVLDLDKVAFVKLAPASAGTINVSVEPLKIAAETSGQLLGVAESAVDAEPVISAKAAIIYDEENGESLWEKNSKDVLPLASLTKIVALKTFLDTRPTLSDVVAYSVKDEEYNYQYADKLEIARLKVDDGDTLTVEDLLYSALVGSANNAVESLVRASGFSRQDFINKMNETVSEWGAKSTKFFEPTGLDPNNVSSARDYAIIASEALKNPIIAKASTMASYKFTTLNTEIAHTIRNTDQIIKENIYNITGSKTGYLDEAGYCLMTRVEQDGKKLIVVTFGVATRTKSFAETKELIKYGLSL